MTAEPLKHRNKKTLSFKIRKKRCGVWNQNSFIYFCTPIADVAKLVDALDLGSSAARHGGSSPFIRTSIKGPVSTNGAFLFQHF